MVFELCLVILWAIFYLAVGISAAVKADFYATLVGQTKSLFSTLGTILDNNSQVTKTLTDFHIPDLHVPMICMSFFSFAAFIVYVLDGLTLFKTSRQSNNV